MTMWTPEEGKLYEALNKVLVGIIEAREGLEVASNYDAREYLRVCADKLQEAYAQVWPVRQDLITIEKDRRQARGKERDDATTE